MKPVLFFDVMDTLVHDPFRQIPGFFGMSFPELFQVKHPTAWVEFEKGNLHETEFLANFFADGRVYDHNAMVDLMREGYAWIDGMPALLLDLRSAGFELHTLSNYPIWWKMIEEKLQLSDHVSWTFVSCMHGLRKPDPAAYLRAAELVEADPSHCLFIDDRNSNCDAARGAGMDALTFENASQLRRDLMARGIL